MMEFSIIELSNNDLSMIEVIYCIIEVATGPEQKRS